MAQVLLFLALFVLAACTGGVKTDEGDTPVETGGITDQDGDGYYSDEDCNDLDASTNPGVFESCDGVDNDCNGAVDDGISTTWYADTDGDGFGDASEVADSCYRPDGYVPNGNDCDDANEDIYPGSAELCDGIDNDCDDSVDEDATSGSGTQDWYADADGDGFGDPAYSIEACGEPDGYVDDASDCDDGDEAIHPDADELCNDADDDCDGDIDEDPVDPDAWYADTDGDGYGDPDAATLDCDVVPDAVADASDCDDGDELVHPDADELCDGQDNDCDGDIDEGAGDASLYYADSDGDTYGDPDDALSACAAPDGYGEDATDCDDADEDVHPGASERCNDRDDDCDGVIDEDPVDPGTWYTDGDGDSYGDAGAASAACDAPTGTVADATDCDDGDDDTYPGAPEVCDSEDNDCDGAIDEDAVGLGTWYADADHDGYGDPDEVTESCEQPTGYVDDDTDCDDDDADINPAEDEVCNSLDDDCDGRVDEGAVDADTWYTDHDGDTYGDSDSATTACSAPSGTVADATDCDDADADVHPGATEHCDDVDEDCDGTVDDSAADRVTWYADADGDLYGSSATKKKACDAPTGYVEDKTDCDDTDVDIHPGATEVCNSLDDDCDGSVDEGAVEIGTWYADSDGDGYGDADVSTSSCTKPTGYVSNNTDCDDAASSVHPSASELCNSVDDDCDGAIDEDATDASTYYADADADTYGDSDSTTTACSAPAGYVADKTDCEDADSDIHPGATEHCDSVDEDCDGTADDSAVDRITWYKDTDGDTYGASASSKKACSKPSGYVEDKTDCDDTDSGVYPGAPETCDGEDDDCDGSIDEGATDVSTWYDDDDSDGYGDPSDTTTSCSKPTGYSADKTDCDDTASSIHPGASELCNSKDDDCDGSVDEGATDVTTYYDDDDGDGYGDPSDTTTSCSKPTGYSADKTDCDDTASTIHPGASETCNSKDDDCDGSTDESATDASTWYRDSDSDSYGKSSSTKTACTKPSGYVSDKTDCDDTDSGVYPGAPETCDGEDDDCDGSVDEGATDASTWYRDADSDTYGDASSTSASCSAPTGYVSDRTDCDDADSSIHPLADEVCNGEDDDCDGSIDEGAIDAGTWYSDDDGDDYGDASSAVESCTEPAGSSALGTDCDDTDAGVHPGASETCDDEDDDCDGSVDEGATDASTWYRDADTDTYGDPATTTTSCDLPSGYVAGKTDCDDTDSSVHPGATETCDDQDEDCDGSVDEGVGSTWYKDADGDSYGTSASTKTSCTLPTGYSADSTDCDDSLSSVYPGAAEVCEDSVDQDCDGEDAPCAPSGDTDLSLSDAKLLGTVKFDYAADAISMAGDVDMDGYDDVIVGAYGEDTKAKDAGAAYLVLGPVSGSFKLSASDGIMYGETSSDNAGSAVDGAGDLDGDGYGDLLVGAKNEDTSGAAAGAVYVVGGPVSGAMNLASADAKIVGAYASDTMGLAVSSVGDMDGDGYDDMLVSAYQDDSGGTSSGAAFLYNGPVGGSLKLSDADGKLVGEVSYDFAGRSLDGGADVDADGVEDLLVGAYGEDAGGSVAGAAYLVTGPLSGTVDLSLYDAKLTGTATLDYGGHSVSFAGDTNNDGYDDMLVGAYQNDTAASNAGAAYLILGPQTGAASLSTADAIITGVAASDAAGYNVSDAGDVDSDGNGDILVGAYKDDAGGLDSGTTGLFLGSLSGTVALSAADAYLIGEVASDYAGWDVSPGGDINADGFSDFLIGAWKDDTSASDAGAGYVLYGGAL